MARRTDDITFNVTGQSLLYRAPQGRPTSATFKIVADSAGDDDTEEFSGTATVDSVNTTLNASAGPAQADPQNLPLTSVAGIVTGRKYRVSQLSKVEWVEPIEIGVSSIRVRHPLQNDYTTGALFQSTYLSAAIDATWVVDENNLSDHEDPNPDYRVIWTIVFASGPNEKAYSYFDLVRAPVTHGVTLADVEDRWPGILAGIAVEQRTDQGQGLLDSAWRYVRIVLANAGLNDAALREDERVDEAVILALVMNLAFGGHSPTGYSPAEFYVVARERFERYVEQTFVVVTKVPTAKGSESAATKRSAPAYWRK